MKVGIFGCGGFAPVHIAHIRRLGANIVGVCDPNEERGHSLAQRYGIPHVFRDGEQLLGEMRPDVVHIVTPPDTHRTVPRRVRQSRSCISPLTDCYILRSFLDLVPLRVTGTI